jgi:SpoVK/Ycf46/Vps4 family AAA+-type ATPase
MTLWDGLTSTNAAGVPARIVVLGATNRINDIDEAILRRMPKKFPVPLPGKEQRRRILQLILGDTKRDPENFDLDFIAKVTAGMSGSDIKEACRDAAMAPMREYLRQHRESGKSMSAVNPEHVRGIRTEDFFGRRSGRILAEIHSREQSTVNGLSKDSSDGYEDVEDAEEEQVTVSGKSMDT